MDSNPYEKCYRDARERLILRGKDISPPIYRDGIRYCAMEGLLLTDRDIFIEAWSEEMADAILDDRSITGYLSPTPARSSSCTECERLLLAYSFSHETYWEVLRLKVETGGLRALLSDELMDALRQKCEMARQSLFDHEQSHPVSATVLSASP